VAVRRAAAGRDRATLLFCDGPQSTQGVATQDFVAADLAISLTTRMRYSAFHGRSQNGSIAPLRAGSMRPITKWLQWGDHGHQGK